MSTTTTTVYEVRYYTKADLEAGYITFYQRCKTLAEAEAILRDWNESGKTQHLGVNIHKVQVDSWSY